MNDNVLKIIKDELERLTTLADAWDDLQLETTTKALSVAVTKLKEISMESSTTECSHDDLVKLENRVTKKAHFAIKQIANILSGGKDGE